LDEDGNLSAGFIASDVEMLRETFTNSETGESYMSLKISAGVTGSEVAGYAALDLLPSVELKITFVSNDAVETCASAVLEMDSVTARSP
jgi:hypothetical protein